MGNPWKSILGFFLVGTAVVMSTSAQAASGTGPYYAVPSWDQKLVCSALANCPRFIVLTDWNNEAVLDRETGVVWQKTPASTPLSWFDASRLCMEQQTGGRMGWRLPTVQELTSLLDPATASGGVGPGLPPGQPFVGVNGVDTFWSVTQAFDVSSTASKFAVTTFATVQITAAVPPASPLRFWCVRTPQAENPQ